MTSVADPRLPPRWRAERSDKSAERIAIEKVLSASTTPLTRAELCASANVAPSRASVVLGNLCSSGYAHRIAPAAGEKHPRFGWGMAPAPALPSRIVTHHKPGEYTGGELQPFTGRPGAMDAFRLPSVQNGRPVERRAPVIMGSPVSTRRPQS